MGGGGWGSEGNTELFLVCYLLFLGNFYGAFLCLTGNYGKHESGIKTASCLIVFCPTITSN